jgi:hypothetical protein
MAGERSFVTAYGLAQLSSGLVTWASRHVYMANATFTKLSVENGRMTYV